MARLPHPSNFGRRHAAATPEQLQIDLQLDLLVDNELPDDERRILLDSLSASPDRWRSLATRFLERQAERTAVRQLIAGTPTAADIPPSYPFPARPASWLNLRAVAALLIVAALSAAAGLHFGQNPPSVSTALASNEVVTTPLPASVLGPDEKAGLQVDVPVVSRKDVPSGYPFVNDNSDDAPARHVMIVPHGPNHAIIFPVTNLSKPGIVY